MHKEKYYTVDLFKFNGSTEGSIQTISGTAWEDTKYPVHGDWQNKIKTETLWGLRSRTIIVPVSVRLERGLCTPESRKKRSKGLGPQGPKKEMREE